MTNGADCYILGHSTRGGDHIIFTINGKICFEA